MVRQAQNKQPRGWWQHSQLVKFAGSRVFFRISLILFTLQAGWIAISNRFPLAFDEGTHFGIIKLYSGQWSPFFGHQPAGGNAFGALTRDPSYLFHYLMSFPYRVFHAIIPSFAANVIFLRFIDVALFVVGIIIFRRLLLEMRLARSVVNGILFCLMLLPVVPLIAANINYDNLLLPLTALALLLGLRVVRAIAATGTVKLVTASQLVIVCCFASLTKYSFLPLFIGIVFGIAGFMIWKHRNLSFSIGTMSRAGAVLLVAGLLLGTGLFVERYGYNTWRYHTPIPQCDKVLSVASCSAYGPWTRNYTLAATAHPSMTPGRFKQFNEIWLKTMSSGLFSVVEAQAGRMLQPVRFLVLVGLGIGAFGTVMAVLYWRSFKAYAVPLVFLLVVAGCYIGALWLQNLADFSHLGIPIAVQARYLLPVLPLLAIIPAVGIALALRDRPRLNLALASVTISMFLVAGGATTYILRSDDSWYWSGGTVASINNATRQVLEFVFR